MNLQKRINEAAQIEAHPAAAFLVLLFALLLRNNPPLPALALLAAAIVNMRFSTIAASVLAAAAPALGCDGCYGRSDASTHQRMVRRMQPGAQNASSSPRADLEWGESHQVAD
jgi:hypothetical protein